MILQDDPPEFDESTRIFLRGFHIGFVIVSTLWEVWLLVRRIVRGRHGN